MPPWLPSALPFIAVVLSVVMFVFKLLSDKKLRFVSTEEEANRVLKLLGLWFSIRISNLISIGLISYSLFLSISSSEPLTRWAVFSIAWGVAGLVIILMFLVIEYFIARIGNQRYNDFKGIWGDIKELADIASDLRNIQTRHLALIKNTSDTLFNHLDRDHSKASPN